MLAWWCASDNILDTAHRALFLARDKPSLNALTRLQVSEHSHPLNLAQMSIFNLGIAYLAQDMQVHAHMG